MDARFLLSFLLVSVVQSTGYIRSYTEDYCWRDYDGIIPSDALPAGINKAGRPIYIGQALFEEKIIPGKINEHDENVFFEWKEKEYARKENVKIFCSNQPQKFEWLDTKKDQVSYLTDKVLIRGGFEPTISTYIGRAVSNGETLVGKIICGTDDCFGLYTTSNGAFHLHGVFQILTYNPNAPHHNSTCVLPLDVRGQLN